MKTFSCPAASLGVALALVLPIGADALSVPGRFQDPDDLPLSLLELETFKDPTGAQALRGLYRVFEDREHLTGKLLELELVVLLATGPDPAPDPIFMIAGGPGQAASTTWRGALRSPLRERRDLVFVDQRGTNGNHALRCKVSGSSDDLQGYLDPLFDPEAFRECMRDLSQHADLSLYSTNIAADDLDEVREALGYEKINLQGGSYGTRASLVYMRRHPDRVRTAILNGVAPIAFTNPLFHAQAAQLGLQRILEECAADPVANAAFPNLGEEIQEILANLRREPVTVPIRHPVSGDPVELRMTRDAFAEALRVMMYYTPTNRQVPLMVHRAREGDFTPFAELALRSNRGIRDQLALGMLLSVTCSEDVARIDEESVVAATTGTFLGDVRVRAQMAVCEFWPHSDVGDDYGDPVTSEAPVLVLSGTHDPVTPPIWGTEAASHMPNSRHLIVPGAHGVAGSACLQGIILEFLESGTVEGLDASCIEKMRMPAFAR